MTINLVKIDGYIKNAFKFNTLSLKKKKKKKDVITLLDQREK